MHWRAVGDILVNGDIKHTAVEESIFPKFWTYWSKIILKECEFQIFLTLPYINLDNTGVILTPNSLLFELKQDFSYTK